ncbi:hypothetical protein KIN20_009997 [Parelaphostrongylus tenuis]|uniref:C2H2-type domain-containing protein n=1 Tax=Parelaphostrongylus tenuis TaxID=148309 RepID=A0AAD5MSN9_PARTN|nr:hypothetical protein KIN20_009997 [Parelaphostrongylus tenuis]
MLRMFLCRTDVVQIPVYCDDCDKEFAIKCKLQRHIAVHQFQKTPDMPPQLHQIPGIGDRAEDVPMSEKYHYQTEQHLD